MRLFKKYADSDLIEGLLRNDNKILEYLYDAYFETISDYLRKNSGTEEDIYDVMQESIVILFKQVRDNHFELKTDLKGYFFGIARNVWNAQLREKKRVTSLDIDIEDEGDQIDTNQATLERIVSRSFNLLKEDCQMIINLFMEGVNYDDIARKMGLKNESYAKRKKYLCKEALMDIIKSDNEYHDLGFL